MSLPSGFEYDCMKKCKSIEHGNKVTAACTKSISDSVLGAFLLKTCRNFAEVSDKEGVGAIHQAASTNRHLIVDWLLKNGANANAKDTFGQTPLHRAVFFGCIKSAVVLLQNNASLDVCDVDHLCPLHYCLTNKKKPNRLPRTETFAFGSNSHYNLGLDIGPNTQTPKCIEFFRRNNISIKYVALSGFHSLFLSITDDVYAVGHGIGGRLGHGQETTVVQPQKLNLRLKRTDEKIISFSASKNHSLILSNISNVYACGSNAKGQLGVRNNESNLLEFKNINCADFLNQNLVRVIALDNHSVAFSNSSVFAWGQNLGQMGLRTTEGLISTPHMVLSGQQILLLSACNTGMAFYSANNMLNIFSSYKMRFSKTPSLEVINQLAITDEGKVLKILVLTDSYQIYIWDDVTQKYTKCNYSISSQFEITKILWSGSKIVILADGDVYMSSAMNTVNYNESDDVSEYQEIYSTKKDICQTHMINIQLKRLVQASNVKDIWSDSDGLNCIFVRDDPYVHLKVPTIHEQEVILDVLHDEMTEFDGIHDISFHVAGVVFPAHKFVLLSRAPESFGPWIESSEDKKNVYLDMEGLSPIAFEIILKIIYKNHILGEQDIQRIGDHKAFEQLMKKLNLGQFVGKTKKNMPVVSFDRNCFPELWDVTINCANERQVHAHKCILVSRLKYFNMMFSSSWMESKEVNFTTIPIEYVEVLVDFLYDNSARLLAKKYTEAFITNMIVVADQLLCVRLKDIFQVHLIKRYTMKRTAEWLELAYTYRCDLLKTVVLDFLCANLRDVLENRLLENVDEDYLTELEDRYKIMFPEIMHRQVVPSPAIGEDEIETFVRDVVFDLTAVVKVNKKGTSRTPKEPKSTTKTKTDYEKEGKLSLLLKDDLEKKEESPSKVDKNIDSIVENSSRVALEIQEQNKSIWTKVVDKRPDSRRKHVGLLNANEVLRNEEKMCENFLNLKLTLNDERSNNNKLEKTPCREGESAVQESPVDETQFKSPISFGDFLSPHSATEARLSQKQRKRLKSGRTSESGAGGDLAAAHRAPESVWNVPTNNSAYSPLDLGENAKKNRTTNGESNTKKLDARMMINFDVILDEEKRESEYVRKLKSKSLALTQLEESAIAELLVFYQVNQVFDETIVIARKVRQQVSQNFSQWGRNSENAVGASALGQTEK